MGVRASPGAAAKALPDVHDPSPRALEVSHPAAAPAIPISHPAHDDAGAAAGGGAWQIKGESGAHSAWLTKPCVGRHEAGVAEVVELMAILVVASGAAVASIA